MSTTIIPIKGMSCMGCVNSVKTILEKIPGVNSVEVSLDNAQAVIQYDTTIADHAIFKRAVEEAGFEVAK